MELTELYFGFKSAKQAKTVPSRETSGLAVPSISETGAITARKVSASSTTSLVISTKVCGVLTSVMDKVLTGAWKPKS